ncbi:hypothetical protein L596_026412 [Steinernema carpocapsae]|uniref:Uncharacterized protein n=1 Tax=Steinernema carpocapsae TaxID=34508 RepID=A0A4V5ZY71_STECR|nr:hypothetical protein L596_026412 [Steinernema carpocapsae]
MPMAGIEPASPRPQRGVLTTILSSEPNRIPPLGKVARSHSTTRAGGVSMENGENDRGVVKIGVVLGRLAANRKFDVQNCGGGRPSRFAPKFAGIGGVWRS